MKTPPNTFASQYKRKSQSPWDDDSKVLWLADYLEDNGKVTLSFGRYIYLHRDNVGRVLGISISKQLLEEHPEFESRYLEGVEMKAMLLLHWDDVTEFCELYADEFEELFLLSPDIYFHALEQRWMNDLESLD